MKDKNLLILVTILFLFTASLLLFSALNEYSFGGDNVCMFDGERYVVGDEIDGYILDNECFCSSGGLIECTPIVDKNIDKDMIVVDSDSLDRDGLDFEYSYLVGISRDDLSTISSVEFKNIFLDGSSLTVIIEQLQLCPSTRVVSEQVGFYKKMGDRLNLYSMIRPVASDVAVDCIVELKYKFDDFDKLDVKKTNIRFVDEYDVLHIPNVCFYNSKVYSDGDVFENDDKEICSCNEGVIVCD